MLQSQGSPTIVDAGCGTGSLLLPLAHCFPSATFVGIGLKRRSLDRMLDRASSGGLTTRDMASTTGADGPGRRDEAPGAGEGWMGEWVEGAAGVAGATSIRRLVHSDAGAGLQVGSGVCLMGGAAHLTKLAEGSSVRSSAMSSKRM